MKPFEAIFAQSHWTDPSAGYHLTSDSLHVLAKPVSAPGLRLPSGSVRHLAGYFDILHLQPLAALRRNVRIGLRLSGAGQARIRIQQTAADRATKAISSAKIDLARAQAQWLDIEARDLAGVLSLEIHADTDLQLTGASWGLEVDEKESRRVRLSIVCCTFNRQKEMIRTIGCIRQSSAFQNGQIDLLVIDNGRNLELPEALSGPEIRLVPQRNLGGAGGFTRGILEATKNADTSHILLMDDDVEVLPEVIDRLVNWLSILPLEISVSGAMLDSQRKNVLYEAGAKFHLGTLNATAEYANISLDGPDALNRLAKAGAPDYGAWWFFAFSTQTLKKARLPLPVFIRGDDIEFGVRLSQLGLKTQVIHGLAVWHEPFYLKFSSWAMYYAIRNLSLINILHGRVRTKNYLAMIANLFGQYVLRYDYASAAAIERALSDLLQGPKYLLLPGDRNHLSVIDELKPYPSRQIPAEEMKRLPSVGVPSTKGLGCLARALTVSGHLRPKTTAPPMQLKSEYVSWRSLRTDSYILENPISGIGQLFEKSPAAFWRLNAKMAKTLIRAAFSFNRVCAEFRTEYPNLTSEAAWRAYLDMPADAPTGRLDQ